MIKIPQMEPWFDEAESNAVKSYMQSGGFVTEFKKTQELEKMLCRFTGAKHAVMTVNGTVGLMLALLALDIKTGDEVLVSDLTMIACANAVALIGAKPQLVDVEANTLCLDLERAKEKITKKTRSLMYVTLNGRSSDMKRVIQFCQKNNLFLIEDAAQSLGSYYHGKHLGTFGQMGIFSFSTQKVITTGQGGALVTNDDKLAQKIRRLKDFGRDKGGSDIHNFWGWNFKFTDLQSVIGIEQMKKLPFRLQRKKDIYQRFRNGLKEVKKISFIETNLEDTSPWFIDIYTKDADSLAAYLAEKGIGTRRIYPPIHTQKIYGESYKGATFPIAQKYSQQGLWLPSSSKLTNTEIDEVVRSIVEYYKWKFH